MKYRWILVLILGLGYSIGPSVADESIAPWMIDSAKILASGGDLAENLERSISSQADSYVEQSVGGWLENTEVSVKGLLEGQPQIGILTVQPLYESGDLTNTVFTQASAFNFDGRQTVNIGVGYRRMTDDDNWLIGVNGFYDHEFPYDHQRTSVGVELRSSVIEFNANQYFALTDWRDGADGLDERALDGFDVEAGLALPFMPGGRIYHRQFKWDGMDGAPNLEGSTTSLAIAGHLLVPGLTFEVGATDYDGDRETREFVQLTYRYTPGNSKVTPLFSDKAFAFKSMREHRLDKVRRENRIIKQARGRGTISFR